MKKKDKKENNRDNVEIVVAHYSEDLERLKPYAKYAIVYHKGQENKPRFLVKKRIKIENVGREGETYLQHIINNYNNLADITIFLQGGMHDQIEDRVVYRNIQKYVMEARKYNFSTNTLRFEIKKNPQVKFEGKFKERLNSGKIRKSRYSFFEFYKMIFGDNQPLFLPCFYCANFAASKHIIYKNNREFYEKIHKYFIDHNNPEEGHYLERLRFRIFNNSLNFHYFIKIVHHPFLRIYTKLKKLIT